MLVNTEIWAELVRGPVEPKIEEPAFLGDAAKALPTEPWTEQTRKAWTTAEMARLLPLIGRTKAVVRLAGKAA